MLSVARTILPWRSPFAQKNSGGRLAADGLAAVRVAAVVIGRRRSGSSGQGQLEAIAFPQLRFALCDRLLGLRLLFPILLSCSLLCSCSLIARNRNKIRA